MRAAERSRDDLYGGQRLCAGSEPGKERVRLSPFMTLEGRLDSVGAGRERAVSTDEILALTRGDE